MWGCSLLLCALLAALPLAGVGAQSMDVRAAMVAVPGSFADAEPASVVLRRGQNRGVPQDRPSRVTWFAPLASAVVPGSGQGLLRQQRGVAYLVAEGYLVLQAVRSQRDGGRERDAYRSIARDIARGGFPGTRPDGPWPYYERLMSSLESGAYNRNPAGTFLPEEDPGTFNGAIWLLARETFWRNADVPPDPASDEYRRAITFYQARAANEDFRWSWRDAQLQQDVYIQTIDRANDAYRRSRTMVGLLLANHALSFVDAYASVRLRMYGDPTPGLSRLGVQGALPLPGRR